jgi:hypothetical protein
VIPFSPLTFEVPNMLSYVKTTAYMDSFMIFLINFWTFCFSWRILTRGGSICSFFPSSVILPCVFLVELTSRVVISKKKRFLIQRKLFLRAYQACSGESTSCRAVSLTPHEFGTHDVALHESQHTVLSSLHAAGTFWTVHACTDHTWRGRRGRLVVLPASPDRSGVETLADTRASPAAPRQGKGEKRGPIHAMVPWWRARLTRVDELWPPVVGAAANKGESPLSVGIAIGFVAWQPPPPPSLSHSLSSPRRESLAPISHCHTAELPGKEEKREGRQDAPRPPLGVALLAQDRRRHRHGEPLPQPHSRRLPQDRRGPFPFSTSSPSSFLFLPAHHEFAMCLHASHLSILI